MFGEQELAWVARAIAADMRTLCELELGGRSVGLSEGWMATIRDHTLRYMLDAQARGVPCRGGTGRGSEGTPGLDIGHADTEIFSHEKP